MPFYEDDLLLEQRVRFCELFDLYSSLLTEKQRDACELLLRSDLSVAELGEELGMTRQGAYDLVRRSRDFLDGIERDLGLCGLRKRCLALREIARECGSRLPDEFANGVERLLPENVTEGDQADV